MAQANSGEFVSPEAQLSFSEGLWTPSTQGGTEGGPAKYGCTLIFKKAEIGPLQQAVAKVVHAKWGDKGMIDFKAGRIKNPIFDGDSPQAYSQKTGERWAGFDETKMFIRCKNNEDSRPRVWWKSPHLEATREEVYSGCYGMAVLNAYTWEHPTGGRGVTFNILAFKKVRDGEPLGGRAPLDAEKWFLQIPTQEDTKANMGSDNGGIDIFS